MAEAPSSRFRSIGFVFVPRLRWPVQQEHESVENVAAQDADLLIDHEKLTTKHLTMRQQQISADHTSGARCAVERQ